MKIPTKNGDICPICRYRITKPNVWVRYHVSYRPVLVILACSYCNYTENCMRTGKPIPWQYRSMYRPNRPSRHEMVARFHERFRLEISKTS